MCAGRASRPGGEVCVLWPLHPGLMSPPPSPSFLLPPGPLVQTLAGARESRGPCTQPAAGGGFRAHTAVSVMGRPHVGTAETRCAETRRVQGLLLKGKEAELCCSPVGMAGVRWTAQEKGRACRHVGRPLVSEVTHCPFIAAQAQPVSLLLFSRARVWAGRWWPRLGEVAAQGHLPRQKPQAVAIGWPQVPSQGRRLIPRGAAGSRRGGGGGRFCLSRLPGRSPLDWRVCAPPA